MKSAARVNLLSKYYPKLLVGLLSIPLCFWYRILQASDDHIASSCVYRIAKVFSATYQKKLAEKDTKAVADPGVFSADFYLKSTSGNIQIGAPEVISMNETVCTPIILGEASDSSTDYQLDESSRWSTFGRPVRAARGDGDGEPVRQGGVHEKQMLRFLSKPLTVERGDTAAALTVSGRFDVEGGCMSFEVAEP